MDVNYYLHREQVERMRAMRASSAEARAIHSEMADLYRARIVAYRTQSIMTVRPIAPSIEPLLIVPAAA